MNTFSKLAFAGTATLASLSACSGERAEFSPETAPTMIEQAQEGPVPSIQEGATPSTLALIPAESGVACQPYMPAADEVIDVLYFTDPVLETEDEYYSRLTRELPKDEKLIGLGSCFGIGIELLSDLIKTDASPISAIVNGEVTYIDSTKTIFQNVECSITGLVANLDVNGPINTEDIQPVMDGDRTLVELACTINGITNTGPSI